MAFATDAQRRWFFAHLATGMRHVAWKMKGGSPEHKPRDERADELADATWKLQHPETLKKMRSSIARAKSAAIGKVPKVTLAEMRKRKLKILSH